ncbi:Bll4390 protein [hydrothermal vent metagenome]|uniref:Bll4390 protein n=1 Tax=hydrothermal vent metagenome TaxID=652676 RepID=A0A1W1BJ43_9ZZZZ
MIINPITAVASLGILFAIYFFMDSFASVALAFELRPEKMWWMSLINGLLSLVIGIYFIIGWPISSMFLVGFLVGVSLFFDGIVLLSLGSVAKTLKEKEV